MGLGRMLQRFTVASRGLQRLLLVKNTSRKMAQGFQGGLNGVRQRTPFQGARTMKCVHEVLYSDHRLTIQPIADNKDGQE